MFIYVLNIYLKGSCKMLSQWTWLWTSSCKTSPFPSPACQCNGHSMCVNGSVCEQCRNLTTGPHCQTCMPGYHGDPTNGGKCQGKCCITAEISYSAHTRVNEFTCYCFDEAVKWCILISTHPPNIFSFTCELFISVNNRSTLNLKKYNTIHLYSSVHFLFLFCVNER